MCTVDGCFKLIKRQGFCYGHYMKQWRYGTPEPMHTSRFEDITGQQFGTLTVMSDRSPEGWLCRFDLARQRAVA